MLNIQRKINRYKRTGHCKENGYNFRVMTDEEEKTWRELTDAAASDITYQE